MKVYITTCKDGLGGYCVDQVFSNLKSAVNFLIRTHFADNTYYSDFSARQLEAAAKLLVQVYEVVD